MTTPNKIKRFSLTMTEADYDRMKTKSKKAGRSMGQYLLDRLHGLTESVVPEVNQDAVIALREVAQAMRENEISTPQLETLMDKIFETLTSNG